MNLNIRPNVGSFDEARNALAGIQAWGNRLQAAAAMVYVGAGGALPTSGWTKLAVNMGQRATSAGAACDAANQKIVIREPGVYLAVLRLTGYVAVSQGVNLVIAVNTVGDRGGTEHASVWPAGSYETVYAAGLLNLAAGDELEPYVLTASDDDVNYLFASFGAAKVL